MTNFNNRLLNALVEVDDRLRAEIGPLCRWEGRNGYVPNGIHYRQQERLKALDSMKYQEYDLRGLSKPEKEFVRNNEYKCYVDINGKRYYMFIGINSTTGKRQMYGHSKKQILNPNGHDVDDRMYNYSIWLTLNTQTNLPFYNHSYEHRPWRAIVPFAI